LLSPFLISFVMVSLRDKDFIMQICTETFSCGSSVLRWCLTLISPLKLWQLGNLFDATDEVANGWAPKSQCHPGRLPSYTCPETYMKCHTIENTGCLSNEKLCDGKEDCQDHSDETNCPNVNFQLSSSTVLGVFIFALLIFTVTLCIAVLGVYATNKARGRRRRAAQRQEERRSRLRDIFAISGGSTEGRAEDNNTAASEGLDNPNFDEDPSSGLSAPPPYALVVEAGLLEEERRRQNPSYRTSAASSSGSMAKPPSYEDIFGSAVVSSSLDPSRSCVSTEAASVAPFPSTVSPATQSAPLDSAETIVVHSPLADAIISNHSIVDESHVAFPASRQPSITVSMATETDRHEEGEEEEEEDDDDDDEVDEAREEVPDEPRRDGVMTVATESPAVNADGVLLEDPPPAYEEA